MALHTIWGTISTDENDNDNDDDDDDFDHDYYDHDSQGDDDQKQFNGPIRKNCSGCVLHHPRYVPFEQPFSLNCFLLTLVFHF